MQMPHKLLRVPEAAEWLGLQPSTVRRLISERRIGVCRLGRAVRIPVAEVVRLQTEGWSPRREEVSR